MAKYALITAGVVKNIIEAPSPLPPEISTTLLAQFNQVVRYTTEFVEPGYLYAGGVFSPDPLIEAEKQAAIDRRETIKLVETAISTASTLDQLKNRLVTILKAIIKELKLE